MDQIIFAVLVLICLVPIWLPKYFPSEDGPSHLQTAKAIRFYNDSEYPIYREYYQVNRDPEPYLLGHLFLALLMFGLPPLAAEKVFLSLYVIGFAFIFRYALGEKTTGKRYVQYLAIPFIYNYALTLGFYSYAYAFVLFFLLVGSWLR